MELTFRRPGDKLMVLNCHPQGIVSMLGTNYDLKKRSGKMLVTITNQVPHPLALPAHGNMRSG
jgi:hypothetical protein